MVMFTMAMCTCITWYRGQRLLDLTLLRLEKSPLWSDCLDALIARELPFGVPTDGPWHGRFGPMFWEKKINNPDVPGVA